MGKSDLCEQGKVPWTWTQPFPQQDLLVLEKGSEGVLPRLRREHGPAARRKSVLRLAKGLRQRILKTTR